MGYQYIFKRIEKKYMLSKSQYQAVIEGIREHMSVDKYGETTICNVYFDSQQDSLIRISIDKPVYKEKLRLRSYGIATEPTDTVFLEIKKKYKGTVYKRRISMTLKDAQEYIDTGIFPESIRGHIPQEIDYMVHYWNLYPKVFIAYDRTAYRCDENPELRITFDKNIRSRYDNLSFQYGDSGKPLLDEDTYIMEIKVPGAAPLWLVHLLSENSIFSRSFSKYGTVYTNKIMEEM